MLPFAMHIVEVSLIVISKIDVVYHVREDGWAFISQDDVTELHYKYQAEPRPALI